MVLGAISRFLRSSKIEVVNLSKVGFKGQPQQHFGNDIHGIKSAPSPNKLSIQLAIISWSGKFKLA